MDLRLKKRQREHRCGERRGMGQACSRDRKSVPWVLPLEGFMWRSQEQTSIEHSSAFQVCPFKSVVSTNWLAPRHGVISHRSCSRCQPWGTQPGCFSWPEAETQHKPRCYLQGFSLRQWSCRGLYGSHFRLFSGPLVLPLVGSTT